MENDPLIGRQLGAYLIQARVGEGGMAWVYKAYHARLRREVALKVIQPHVAGKSGFRERFEREAQLVASLTHPNIVAVYDFGESGNLTYLVMQYVAGGTLREQLRVERSLDPRRATHYAIQMARALHHAHGKGIVHRDVKPQNMLVSASDTRSILLSDFGIAKLFDASQEGVRIGLADSMNMNPSLTSVGQIVGTAEYMAPEQINQQAVDARTDIYALGIVLFQMLTGEVPFSSTTVQGLLFQHVFTPAIPVRQIKPDAPEMLEQIILRALAKAPEQRYQSAEAMAVALEAFLLPTNGQRVQAITGTSTTSGQAITDLFISPVYSPSAPSSRAESKQHFDTGVAIMGQAAVHTTTVGGLVVPAQADGRKRVRGRILLSSLLALGVILAILAGKVLPPLLCAGSPSCSTAPPNSTQQGRTATSFIEDFHNNDRSWTIGSLENGNLSADITNNRYTLMVGSGTNTYLPNPSTAIVGTLPTRFILSAQITQNAGTLTTSYGLAFHFQQNGAKVSCYALVIDSNGDYEVFKYNTDVSSTPALLWSMHHFSAIHEGLNSANTLQVIVQGSSFSFTINGTPVPVGAAQGTTLSDNAFTGGNLALLVSGPNSRFTVAWVRLKVS